MPKRKFINLIRKKTQHLVAPPPKHYLDAESELGVRLFGPVPDGIRREFFHSTVKNVWIWHENGLTIRYEVRPHGVFKRVGSEPFVKLQDPELSNFRLATHHYLSAIKSHLYPAKTK